MDAKPIQMRLPVVKIRTSHLRAGSLRTKEAIYEAVKRALNRCHMDREKVAKELSRLVGEEISVHALNNWMSMGKTNRRFPLEFAKALSMITGDKSILVAALQPEFDVMDERAKVCYDYGVMMLENKVRNKKKRQLEELAIRERFGSQ